jgi:riboflavin kinase/FMN adenylyltransferase
MHIIRHYRDIEAAERGAVAALGNFDGVHRGHRALLAKARAIADETGVPLAAIVFEPYPREFFRPDDPPFRLTPFRTKARLLAECGVDLLIVLKFDAALAAMPAQDFVLDILAGALGVGHVVVGADFRFGRNRGGDAAVLAYMGGMEGFGVTVVPPLEADDEGKVSSSRIRNALRQGRPEEAARLLGHVWSIEGHVRHGDERGRTLGYPTANLTLEGTLLPAFGVYAVRAHLADGTVREGVANFGRRPTYEVPTPLFEVYLFDFSGDLYEQLLRVDFVRFLRPEIKFPDVEALKAQLAKDCEAARAIFATP